MRLADTVLVVLAPGMGDGVQAAKAGILEIADLLVVNKADRDGAGEHRARAQGDGRARPVRDRRSRPVARAGACTTVASTGAGLDELARRDRCSRRASRCAWRRRSGVGGPAPRWPCRPSCWTGSHAALASAAVRDRLAGAAREVADGPPGPPRRRAECSRGVAVRTSVGSMIDTGDRGGAMPQRAACRGHDHRHERREAVRRGDGRATTVSLAVRARRVLRHPRAERRRQDHPAGDHRGPARAGLRHGHRARRAQLAAQPAGCCSRIGVQLQASSFFERLTAREQLGHVRARCTARRRHGSTRCSSWSRSPTRRTRRPRSSPAVRPSGCRSPAR